MVLPTALTRLRLAALPWIARAAVAQLLLGAGCAAPPAPSEPRPARSTSEASGPGGTPSAESRSGEAQAASSAAAVVPSGTPAASRYRTEIPPAPTELRETVSAARSEVERFFGVRLAKPYQAMVLPDRAAFDRLVAARWGIEPTACSMVAVGVASTLAILDPAVWRGQACGHDPADAAHLRRVLAYELTHVLQQQRSSTDQPGGPPPLDWFTEGVAVLASGQLDEPLLARVRSELETDRRPARLRAVFQGEARYGLAGSLVSFIDQRVGRAALAELLCATTSREILERVGMSEPELLAAWRVYVSLEY